MSSSHVCCFLILQKKARVAFSDQEGRNELLGGEDSHSSEDQVGFNSHNHHATLFANS